MQPASGPAARTAPFRHSGRPIAPAAMRHETRSDVVGAYAGLRPLVADGSVSDGFSGNESTLRVSREHRVRIESDGLARIGGGKYTTYRVMAADVVDAALDAGFGIGTARARPSRTSE